MRIALAILLFVLVPIAGCFNGDLIEASQRLPSPGTTSVFITVPGRAPLYVVEHLSHRFTSGKLALPEAPYRRMRDHDLGALPARMLGGAFHLWRGAWLSSRPAFPRHAVTIPTTGGPWRALVVQLRPGTRYPGDRYWIVPGQDPFGPAFPVLTQLDVCLTANLIACVPWSVAVQRGLVACHDRRRMPLPAATCARYAPHTLWHVVGIL